MNPWESRKLTDLAEYLNGYAFAPEDWGVEGLPIIRIQQLKNPNAPTDFYAGKLPEKNIINDGDLIFSWSASLFLRIWTHGKGALNQHLFKVVEKTGVDRAFLKAFIEFYLPELTKASHGSTMQHITRKELDKLTALFPIDIAEQKNIVAIIDLLDQAIEQTEAIIAKQQRIKTGLMQDLLTKGIDENGNIRSEATHEFKDSPLGRIPVEWNLKAVGDIFTMQLGKMLNKKAVEGKSPFPYLGNKNVQWDQVDLSELLEMDFSKQEQIKFKLIIDDILVCEGGEVGRTALWHGEHEYCFFQKAVHRLRPIENKYLPRLFPRFMSHVISKGILLNFTSQTSIAHLTQEKLAILPIFLPKLNEQKRICEVFDQLDEDIFLETSKLNKMAGLKVGLMHDLLTGKVRVTDIQTPTLTLESLCTPLN